MMRELSWYRVYWKQAKLSVHGISGADTVAALHGIGKTSSLKIATKHSCSISSIGHRGDEKAILKSTESSTAMTDCRIKMWRTKTASSGTSSFKLCSPPPTSDSFSENVLRCHLQVATWKAALEESPPNMDPTKEDWRPRYHGTTNSAGQYTLCPTINL